eukprot:scaffold99868_cov30-Tisochrysis_lutea.AAC.2
MTAAVSTMDRLTPCSAIAVATLSDAASQSCSERFTEEHAGDESRELPPETGILDVWLSPMSRLPPTGGPQRMIVEAVPDKLG